MFHLMLQKVLHKKWMAISLLIGNILLVAIAVSHPMYQDASRNRMLTDEFTNYMKDNNSYPMMIDINGLMRKTAGLEESERARNFANTVASQFGVSEVEKISYNSLVASTATPTSLYTADSKEFKMVLGAMSDFDKHTKIVSGKMYSDSLTDDGYIEAVISQSAMVDHNLLIGMEIDMKSLKFAGKNKVKIRITGVYSNLDDSDNYWVYPPGYYNNHLMISPKVFEEGFMGNFVLSNNINEHYYVLLDYSQLDPERIDEIIAITDKALNENNTVYSKMAEPSYIGLLKDYAVKEKQISVTLLILQVPVIVLLCAFLFMISRQMLEMEESEIAILKSRGAGRIQIIRLYFFQSLFLSLISFVIGLPLGKLICKILGTSSAFLEFSAGRSLIVRYSGEALLYGLAAVLISTFMTLLPVLKKSTSSIVSVKRKRSRQTKPLWQKLFLDVIMLGASIYGYYSFSSRQDELLVQVLSGESLDPIIFLSSSLFILGAGLFSLRIHSLLILLLFKLGKSRWQPASYTSFLQLIRTGGKQAFIMVFLVLTVAFGMFNTTIARTILANAEKNNDYNIGADVVIQEYWRNNQVFSSHDPSQEVELSYTEPDSGKYNDIAGVKSIAKVYKTSNAKVTVNKSENPITIMGINTKTFGETTKMDPKLLQYNYHEYLNVLSQNSDAVLVSMNFKEKLGVKIGDQITYTIEDPIKTGSGTGIVYGFFDYWPGYNRNSIVIASDGTSKNEEHYMVVAHLSAIQEKVGVFPYEMWINMDGKTDAVYDFINERGIKLTKFVDAVERKEAIGREALFQGTNGILTMSFITILLICGIGYIIYWTLSIRSRELLFGIFRAMGMGKNEVIHMLVNEQVLTGVVAILFGLVIGWISSRMFVPIIQIAYSATDRSLPLELITKDSDIIRLLVIIGIVFIACLAVLIKQVYNMKISQALKLGED
ncbi:MAG: FtsX-like permease family protein [Lachnospiraceae bacterium]|nr:FtsX-like permease family protein [Lachnospiraceae bacterium]